MIENLILQLSSLPSSPIPVIISFNASQTETAPPPVSPSTTSYSKQQTHDLDLALHIVLCLNKIQDTIPNTSTLLPLASHQKHCHAESPITGLSNCTATLTSSEPVAPSHLHVLHCHSFEPTSPKIPRHRHQPPPQDMRLHHLSNLYESHLQHPTSQMEITLIWTNLMRGLLNNSSWVHAWSYLMNTTLS